MDFFLICDDRNSDWKFLNCGYLSYLNFTSVIQQLLYLKLWKANEERDQDQEEVRKILTLLKEETFPILLPVLRLINISGFIAELLNLTSPAYFRYIYKPGTSSGFSQDGCKVFRGWVMLPPPSSKEYNLYLSEHFFSIIRLNLITFVKV